MFTFKFLARSAFACSTVVTGMVMLSVVSPPAMAALDPGAGKVVFQSVCSTCHSVQQGQNKIGPTLFGIVGRKTDSVEGYSYSAANQGAHLTWDESTLDRYLEAPKALIPGTKMSFSGLKDGEKRASLIAYLATLK